MRYLGAFASILMTAGVTLAHPAPAAGPARPSFDVVADFGAKGDGATNDTAAFAAAAEAIRKAGGGTLVIPKRVYVVGRQVHEPGKVPYYQARPIFSLAGADGVTVEGNGATLRLAPGLRYGTFDKASGEPANPGLPFYDRDYAVSVGTMFEFTGCRNVAVRDLELDGNSGRLVLGGMWGDTGRQLAAYGLAFHGCRDVRVDDVHTHHHALDGVMIAHGGLKEQDPPTPHTLVGVVSEYNGRQGLSWVGGRGIRVYRSKFNHTARGAVASAPAAGLDIEAEDSVCRDGYFEECEFADNAGCGVVADSGDGGFTTFVRCAFWGTTNWSAWPRKPGMVFTDCAFHGSVVHGWGSKDRPELATRFTRCHFEDKEYNGKCYRSAAVIECGGGDNITFDGCTVVGRKTRALWVDGADTREVLRGCTVTHAFDAAPDHEFLSLLRGCTLENVTFKERLGGAPAGHVWYVEAHNLLVRQNVVVEGPRVQWGNWTGGATGRLPVTEPKN